MRAMPGVKDWSGQCSRGRTGGQCRREDLEVSAGVQTGCRTGRDSAGGADREASAGGGEGLFSFPEGVGFPVGGEAHEGSVDDGVVVDEGAEALGEGVFRFDGVLEILDDTEGHIDVCAGEVVLLREGEPCSDRDLGRGGQGLVPQSVMMCAAVSYIHQVI